MAELLRSDVASMNADNFVVRPHLRLIERFREITSWEPDQLDDTAVSELVDIVATLPTDFIDEFGEGVEVELGGGSVDDFAQFRKKGARVHARPRGLPRRRRDCAGTSPSTTPMWRPKGPTACLRRRTSTGSSPWCTRSATGRRWDERARRSKEATLVTTHLPDGPAATFGGGERAWTPRRSAGLRGSWHHLTRRCLLGRQRETGKLMTATAVERMILEELQPILEANHIELAPLAEVLRRLGWTVTPP